MAKHKGQKAKNKSKKAKKAQVPLGPGGTLSKKQKMQSNKYAVASFLQQKKAQGADYKKMRAHGNKKEWKKFAEEVKKAWNGTPETLFFLQNSMNAREVFMAVFKGGPRVAAPAPVAAPVAAAAPPPPPAAVLRPGAEDGELDEALAAEFVPC